jgi:hypothetical protein
MTYINIKNNGIVETVDQFETHQEARAMVKEYNLSDRYNCYYTSQRATKEWREQ